MYSLTKSKIMTGLQCHKKLWYDINDPIKKDSHLFHIGNRFGDYARQYYGRGVNLVNVTDPNLAIADTAKAIKYLETKAIYEGAFLHSETLVRADVILKGNDGWHLIEVKSSTELKQEHIKDASIQAYVIKATGLNLVTVKIAHINKAFEYKEDGNYEGLLIEVDITESVLNNMGNVESWIDELHYLGKNGIAIPKVEMGDQCTDPYPCPYQTRCGEFLPKVADVPISILPNTGGTLAEKWAKSGIYDLRDVPEEALKNPLHKIIQTSHKENRAWISQELKDRVNSFAWPRYFMDFETVQQGVPLLTGTKPYQAVPFQWSVHRWDELHQDIKLEDGYGFLEYFDPLMDRMFLEELLKVIGNKGPIFAHNAATEKTVLKKLITRPNCRDLKPDVENIIARVEDTLDMVRNGVFYSPEMNGSFSLKDIVKAIPTSVDYASPDALSGGGDAQIVWFCCTDKNIAKAEKEKLTRKLKTYCAQDTLALYHLLKFISEAKTDLN